MKELNLLPIEKDFIVSVVKGLHMGVDEFITNVINKNAYDTMIYNWSRQLFMNGVTVKEAILQIQSRRMDMYCNSSINFYIPNNNLLQLNVFQKLKSNTLFSALNSDQQDFILKATQRLIDSNLYFENDIIDQIQLVMQNVSSFNKRTSSDQNDFDNGYSSGSSKQNDLFLLHHEKRSNTFRSTMTGVLYFFFIGILTSSKYSNRTNL